MKKTNFIKLAFLCLGFLFCLMKGAQAMHLYLLSNHTNAGEHNQVLGVQEALKRIYPELIVVDLNTEEHPSAEIISKVNHSLAQDKVIVVASGEPGAEGIKELPLHPHLTVCLMSHMILKGYEDPNVLEKATFVALPIHALSPELRERLGAKLIETTGVAHNRKSEDINAVYRKYGATALPKAKSYFVVILGGDAPPPRSKINRFFSSKDATQLADYVAQHKQLGDYVIVLNGPRTGKFKPDQQEDVTVHRQGYSDPITELFVAQLKEKGVKDFKLFDFQHKTPENQTYVLPFNSFDLAMGAVCSKGGYILVPGESTSMISEVRDLAPKGKVIVYENGAMSDVHHAHVQSERAAGKVSVLKDYAQLVHPFGNSEICVGSSAADTIAQRLEKTVKE